MSSIVIGKAHDKKAHLDVDALLRGRLLIQANSGKGKSWLLRRLAEELFGKIQVILIDAEGEFATLREHYGYVLVGKGGETPADPRSAALVAHKLLELRASAVCDLYEMKPTARHEWVQKFIEAMIDSPKNLWHPCVVIVDEAHIFCPEKGAGESVAAEAIIGMATRGRKRGFALVLATQRLGKLRKDAAAELLNVMIGGTFIDIDRKRAADALGVYGKDQHQFFDDIKILKRGLFYALGPAISDERILVEVGDVKTTHPEAGSARHAAEPPPAPEAVAKLLPKLSDLPKAAEEKAKTEADLRTEIRSLKAQLRTQPTKPVEVKVTDVREIEKAVRDSEQKFRKLISDLDRIIRRQQEALKFISESAAKSASMESPKIELAAQVKFKAPQIVPPAARSFVPLPVESNGDFSLRPGARRMLEAAAMYYPAGVTEGQMAAQAGVKRSGGSFSSYKSNLKTNGLLTEKSGLYHATDAGMAYLGEVPSSPSSTDEVLSVWLPKLRPGAQRMLKTLIEEGGKPLSYEDLSARAGISSDGGSFSSYLSNLRTAGLVIDTDRRMVAANKEVLFL